MTETVTDRYRIENDPEMLKHWMRQGTRTAAFLLVIPGCALVGYGAGLVFARPLPCFLIGLGAGLFSWGLIVALG